MAQVNSVSSRDDLSHMQIGWIIMVSKKYPRSMHFKFSPGATSDDKVMNDEDYESLIGHTLVYTEKLDGSNVCLTGEKIFSRSHAGPPSHVSFGPLKKFHECIRHSIDPGISVFGEWCYALHSIQYGMLQHHLNIFGVREDKTGKWWDWDEVEVMAKYLEVPTAPVILIGAVNNKESLEKNINLLANLSSVYGPNREGLVVRKVAGVHDDGSKLHGLGKWVRANHVQTSVHWRKQKVVVQPAINRI